MEYEFLDLSARIRIVADVVRMAEENHYREELQMGQDRAANDPNAAATNRYTARLEYVRGVLADLRAQEAVANNNV